MSKYLKTIIVGKIPQAEGKKGVVSKLHCFNCEWRKRLRSGTDGITDDFVCEYFGGVRLETYIDEPVIYTYPCEACKKFINE